MRKLFIPLVEGEIQGYKTGIDTDWILWEHIRHFDYQKQEGEYWVGFGVGFTKAQQARTILLTKNKSLSYNKKQLLYRHVMDLYLDDFIRFYKYAEEYLKNIEKWGLRSIPKSVCREVDELLRLKKLQRAIETIYVFNHREHRLESIMEYQEIMKVLPTLRKLKKSGKIDSTESENRKRQLENQLRQWINKWEK